MKYRVFLKVYGFKDGAESRRMYKAGPPYEERPSLASEYMQAFWRMWAIGNAERAVKRLEKEAGVGQLGRQDEAAVRGSDEVSPPAADVHNSAPGREGVPLADEGLPPSV